MCASHSNASELQQSLSADWEAAADEAERARGVQHEGHRVPLPTPHTDTPAPAPMPSAMAAFARDELRHVERSISRPTRHSVLSQRDGSGRAGGFRLGMPKRAENS